MIKTLLKVVLLSIDEDGYHLSVKAKVNGKPANLIIDTGASRTVFDLNRIGKFVKGDKLQENNKLSSGLGTNSMKSHITTLKKFQLGDLVINDYPAVFIDLSHVNVSYVNVGLEPIDGVLGSDILHAYNANINYEKLELVLIERKKKNVTKRR